MEEQAIGLGEGCAKFVFAAILIIVVFSLLLSIAGAPSGDAARSASSESTWSVHFSLLRLDVEREQRQQFQESNSSRPWWAFWGTP